MAQKELQSGKVHERLLIKVPSLGLERVLDAGTTTRLTQLVPRLEHRGQFSTDKAIEIARGGRGGLPWRLRGPLPAAARGWRSA